MNTLKLAGLALCLGSNIALALPCDGFQLNVKNNLLDSLLLTHIKLDNANLEPGTIQKLDAKTQQAFIVNNSNEMLMMGEFSFHTISLPSHEVKIYYTLENRGTTCEFNQYEVDGDYNVEVNRTNKAVDLTINNQ